VILSKRLVILSAVLIMLQAVAVVVLLVGPNRARHARSAREASLHPRLVVAFQESATESAIRETLLAIEGSIVRGPSVEGAYTVEVRLALKSSKDLDKIVEELRSRPQVIQKVERAF
jgi:hypothetical protein